MTWKVYLWHRGRAGRRHVAVVAAILAGDLLQLLLLSLLLHLLVPLHLH
jgi:hypothetical protein